MTFEHFLQYFFNYPGYGHIPPQYWWIDALRIVVRVLGGMFCLLLVVPPLVWYERRLLGWMQQRQGPNRVGPFGLFQTLADGLKLLFKEDMNPRNVDKVLFILAPIVFLIPSLVIPGVIPWGPSKVWGAIAPNVGVGVLYLLAWSSLAVYGIVLAGWSSNNKYSLLGGLRSTAQMISYELGMGLAIITVVLMAGSLNLQEIVANQGYFGPGGIAEWNLGKFFPLGFIAFAIYTVTMLAETNCSPFDLPEAETELVAGYHTEYTSMKFATFFMGEYANMVITSSINATFFWGGFNAPIVYLDGAYLGHLLALKGFTLLGMVVAALVPVFWLWFKIWLGLYFFIWIRATLPRLRYDMLMNIGWQGILPVSLVNILLVAVALATNYSVGVISWAVVSVIAGVVFASSKRTQKFTTNSRRDRTLVLHSSAVSYAGIPEHSGTGAQTLPLDANLDKIEQTEQGVTVG